MVLENQRYRFETRMLNDRFEVGVPCPHEPTPSGTADAPIKRLVYVSVE